MNRLDAHTVLCAALGEAMAGRAARRWTDTARATAQTASRPCVRPCTKRPSSGWTSTSQTGAIHLLTGTRTRPSNVSHGSGI